MRSATLVIASLMFIASTAQALDVVEGGQSQFTIVTPDEPTQTAQFAAEELQSYLQQITGAKLPLVAEADAPDGPCIYVGPCQAVIEADLVPEQREAFAIRQLSDDLLIVGEDSDGHPLYSDSRTERPLARTGTLYGVYELLRRYGDVRWLWPGELGTVVPEADSFTVPDGIDWREAPDFKIRNLWLTYRNPDWQEREYYRWWRRNGQGQALTGNSSHTYSRRLGGNSHFEEHPEYYAMIDGKRRPLDGSRGQICTSNPEVARIFAESLLEDPLDIAPAAPNDGSGFCQCPNCRALDVPTNLIPWRGKQIPALTDRIFTFLNEVATIVGERDPEKMLGHYAYTYFKAPPAEIEDLDDSIVLFFAQACHWFRDPELKERYRGYIDAWSEFGNPMVSREYIGLIYWFDMPNIHTRRIEEEIAYLEDRGFIGMNSEMSRNFATHAPNYYLATRMLWDTSLTREEVLADFYEAGFGPAADDVAEYFDIFEQRLEELGPAAAGAGSANIANIPDQFDAETRSEAREALERAYAKTDDPTVTARLDFLKIGLDYADITCETMRLLERIKAAGVPLARVNAAQLDEKPANHELIDWINEAKRMHARRWEIVKSQGELPALHAPALRRWDENNHWVEDLDAHLADIEQQEAGNFEPLPLEWRFRVEGEGQGVEAGWHLPAFDDSGWETIITSRPWEEQGHPQFDGVGWYRLTFELTEEQAHADPLTLRIGAIDEDGWVWLNGEQIGEIIFDAEVNEDSWKQPLDIDVTGKLNAGDNTIAVRVRDKWGAGGLWRPSYLIHGEQK